VNAPARRRRLWRATLLWAALTFVVWNAVFDRMVVVAGRRYVAHDGHSRRFGDCGDWCDGCQAVPDKKRGLGKVGTSYFKSSSM
jgi:hypothetical protein